MKSAEESNVKNSDDDFPTISSRYLANIHHPVFDRLPQNIFVNGTVIVSETLPVGSSVFQVGFIQE